MNHRILAVVLATTACNGSDDVDPNDDTLVSFDLHDDLSMPEQPLWEVSDFDSAQTCVECHPTHVAEWSTSNHAYAMIDPVFRELIAVRQADRQGQQDQFCTQCHTPIGTRGGDIVDNYRFDDLDPITLEGVTCDGCHKVVDIARPHTSGHVIDPDSPLRATIEDPVDNAFHQSEYSELHSTAEFCGACHDVIETDGLDLERPYAEWTESPSAVAGETCQDCHMPTYEGQAAEGGPTRTLHRHTWVGAGIPLQPGFLSPDQLDTKRADVAELLDGAAHVMLDAASAVPAGEQIDLLVTLRNEIEGHNFPTGTTFNRQAWVEVTARDADDNVLYATGDLDLNGDLRNYWSDLDPYGDDDLILLSSSLTDIEGNPEIFSWRSIEHTSATLSPLYDRTYTLFVPTEAATNGPITIEARLLFRQYGPFLLRAVGYDQYIEDLQIFVVHEDTTTVELQ